MVCKLYNLQKSLHKSAVLFKSHPCRRGGKIHTYCECIVVETVAFLLWSHVDFSLQAQVQVVVLWARKQNRQVKKKNTSGRGGSTSREDRGVWNRGCGLGSLLGRSRVQTWDRSACWLKWVPPAAHVNPITTVAAADQEIGCQTGDDIFSCLCLVSENSKENERAEKKYNSLRAVLYLLLVRSSRLFYDQSSQISAVRSTE